MIGRSVIITGANSGIGFEAARALLRQEANLTVVVAGRHPERVSKAAAALDARRALPRVVDLGSLSSVATFAKTIEDDLTTGALQPLHAIVCNAGVQIIGPTRFSADGFEQTFATNHLGHFALVASLLDRIDHNGRVVVVSSDTHDPARNTGMPGPRYQTASALARGEIAGGIGLDELNIGRIRYTTSKLCNLYFTYALADRLHTRRRKVTVNAFNPGLTPGTRLARDYPPAIRFAFRRVLPLAHLISRRFTTPREQGRALARLVLDASLDGQSRRYFSGFREDMSSSESQDKSKIDDLWRVSLKLVVGTFPSLLGDFGYE